MTQYCTLVLLALHVPGDHLLQVPLIHTDVHGLAHCHHLLSADGTRPGRERRKQALSLPSIPPAFHQLQCTQEAGGEEEGCCFTQLETVKESYTLLQ